MKSSHFFHDSLCTVTWEKGKESSGYVRKCEVKDEVVHSTDLGKRHMRDLNMTDDRQVVTTSKDIEYDR